MSYVGYSLVTVIFIPEITFVDSGSSQIFISKYKVTLTALNDA